MSLKLICQSLHNNHSQPIWINKSTAIYNHWSFIKCPKKPNHLQFPLEARTPKGEGVGEQLTGKVHSLY